MEGVETYTNGRRIGKRGCHVETKAETMHIIVCFLGTGFFVVCFLFSFLVCKSQSLYY